MSPCERMSRFQALLLILLFVTGAGNLFAVSAEDLVKQSGVKGGLIVCIGAEDGSFVADLLVNESFVVHALCESREVTEKIRAGLKERGLYGRVTVQKWGRDSLPHADELVNLVVVRCGMRDAGSAIMRVLAPRGTAVIEETGNKDWLSRIPHPVSRIGNGFVTFTKPVPPEIDEWTHFLHGPDNNAVARDTKVGPPKHLRWIGDPKHARSHEQLASMSAMVTAGGRVFYIVDEGLRADIRMPARWRLVARDAFNGVILWKREITQWANHLHGFRQGPSDLPFRLVAVGDIVYVTLGRGQPVSGLDAATGKTRIVFKGTGNTEQIIHTDTALLTLGGTPQVDILKPKRKTGPTPRVVTASHPDTGDILWKKAVDETALYPMAVSGGALLYQTTSHLVRLDTKTSKERWRVQHPANLTGGHGWWLWNTPTLTVCDGIAYVADSKKLTAFAIDDGKTLWQTKSAQGFNSPADIFVINDLVWRGYTGSRGAADFEEGLNPKTGKIEKTLNTGKAWAYATLAHYRCYKPKATSRFIFSSRSGVELIDMDSGAIYPNHWVRGTCQYGVVPANGLLYAPPHSCACNIKTMMRGVCAFSSSSAKLSPARTKSAANPFEQGPAFGKYNAVDGKGGGWPTFRHDAQRSGRTDASVPANLSQEWKTKISGRLSTLVVGRDKVFVSQIDNHTVHALKYADGSPLWSFTAGGRVDSPPTLYKGLVLFGSADGWIYCLREGDGELAWRFRAAPEARLIMVRGQLESAWPVHGSVLVKDGSLYAAAGRSSYLDSGIHVYRLEPGTGKLIKKTAIYSPDEKTGLQPDGGVDLRGALNDILAASGDSVFMRHLKIDFETGDDLQTGPHRLFAPIGFLDDEWWHRAYWIYGSDPVSMPRRNESGWAIWPRMGTMLPSGRILSMDSEFVYGYGRKVVRQALTGHMGSDHHQLFAVKRDSIGPVPSDRENQHLRYARSAGKLLSKETMRGDEGGKKPVFKYAWTKKSPIIVRALAVAGKTILVAGPPEPPGIKTGTFERANTEVAGFLGGRGAELHLANAQDGTPLAQYKLESSPIFDGMIVAHGKVLMSLQDGSVVCFGPGK
jgi:outer membrane protein assembly factor BamB